MRIIVDSTSNGGDCPAVYNDHPRDGQPGYLIQGKFLTDDEQAELVQVGEDEDAVWVPANVLEQFVEMHLAGKEPVEV